jgi:hypothetical protein
MIALILALACGGGEPTTLEGCDALSDATSREDCRLRVLAPVFEKGSAEEFDAAIGKLEDPLSRDLVRVRLAIDDPSKADRLCMQVETDGARQKCEQVLGRPHLRAPR